MGWTLKLRLFASLAMPGRKVQAVTFSVRLTNIVFAFCQRFLNTFYE
jgi:hypothetical protein